MAKNPEERAVVPQWVPIVGAVAGFCTLAFLMHLVTRPESLDCRRAGLVAFLFAFSTAMSVGFLGGWGSGVGTFAHTWTQAEVGVVKW